MPVLLQPFSIVLAFDDELVAGYVKVGRPRRRPVVPDAVRGQEEALLGLSVQGVLQTNLAAGEAALASVMQPRDAGSVKEDDDQAWFSFIIRSLLRQWVLGI